MKHNTLGEVKLSPREAEIAALVCKGLARKEISARLGISEHTVGMNLSRIYAGVGGSNRVDLVNFVHRNPQALECVWVTDRRGPLLVEPLIEPVELAA